MKATRFVEKRLTKAERIAFELIIPNLLDLLEKEDIHFDLPNRDGLLRLEECKMSKFCLDQIYKHQSPILYSLEAFIGKVDFNKLKKHLSGGSMFCSPSSTTAYLMNVSEWDERAERYLVNALKNGQKNGENGGVACTYPNTTFELTGVLFLI